MTYTEHQASLGRGDRASATATPAGHHGRLPNIDNAHVHVGRKKADDKARTAQDKTLKSQYVGDTFCGKHHGKHTVCICKRV